MGRNPRFAVLEIDGQELGGPQEYIPVSEDIFFDDNFTETVKDKLEDIDGGLPIFCIEEEVEIPQGKQSLIFGRNLEIKLTGLLRVRGVQTLGVS